MRSGYHAIPFGLKYVILLKIQGTLAKKKANGNKALATQSVVDHYVPYLASGSCITHV